MSNTFYAINSIKDEIKNNPQKTRTELINSIQAQENFMRNAPLNRGGLMLSVPELLNEKGEVVRTQYNALIVTRYIDLDGTLVFQSNGGDSIKFAFSIDENETFEQLFKM